MVTQIKKNLTLASPDLCCREEKRKEKELKPENMFYTKTDQHKISKVSERKKGRKGGRKQYPFTQPGTPTLNVKGFTLVLAT